MTMGHTAVKRPALLALYFVCIGSINTIFAQTALDKTYISGKGEIGNTSSIRCNASSENADIEWFFMEKKVKPDERIKLTPGEFTLQGNDPDGNVKKIKTSTLTIAESTVSDAGNYTCVAYEKDMNISNTFYLNLSFNATLVNVTKGPIEVNITISTKPKLVTADCFFEVYNVTNSTEVQWYKRGRDGYHPERLTQIGPKTFKSSHDIKIPDAEADGIYVCEITDPVTQTKVNGTVNVKVIAKPKILLHMPIAISPTEVYLNWTVLKYNSVIKFIYLFVSDGKDFQPYREGDNNPIGLNNTFYIMKNLRKSTEYKVKLEVETDYGSRSQSEIKAVTTLDKVPGFVPNISINGFSATSVTIGWMAPSNETQQYVHYYLLEARKKNDDVSRRAYHARDGNLPYMFDNLEPHSTYIFQVRACFDYGGERCGDWSEEMEAATLDGTPSKPHIDLFECSTSFINLTWSPPERPNAEIKGYTMELTGNATFKDRSGNFRYTTWGPLSKFTTNDSKSVRFDDLQPNTNYTVRLNAMTRTRRRGEEVVGYCTTQPAPPDTPPRPRWRKILVNDKYMFKMYLPRVTERNGPICCYRIYMVRLLQHSDGLALPASPKDIPLLEYNDAYGDKPAKGAYVTDIFSSDWFEKESGLELLMGDSNSLYNRTMPMYAGDPCGRCLTWPKKLDPPTTTAKTTTTTAATTAGSTTTSSTTDIDDDNTTSDPSEMEEDSPEEQKRVKRMFESYHAQELNDGEDIDYNKNFIMKDSLVLEKKELNPFDGPLDPASNYTLFVEIITAIPNEESMYSNYLNFLMPAPTPVASQSAGALEIALQATCAIAALVLLLMIVFCIRQTRRSRKMPPHAHLELNPLQMAYRYITGLGGRPQMVPTAPPDMAPIAKEDLAAAYAERQADSDYGFQKEFEYINFLQYTAERVPKTTKLLQMLPDGYPDRTTHASEARENQPKNRYPDIKAYDQTRVKLSQIDSITGSDYINANYVMGYQDRKRFICAQGPTDTTINDFWRMIWEHGLELIVMLTNLEEYSKIKCSKYWPDEVQGARAFGSVVVQHISEKRYSDYIVRELKITKQSTTSDGQPIIENNGVAKRNGDCKEAAEASAPTSPREVKDDSRIVRQYHFLMWKDFAAPEHAFSILKFIKRVNEAWSNMVNRPAVVHCSAGVGRTGTLVALDYLLEQLKEEGHAAVFNTVAELRRQRNFLVQSLKQYVFVYRALVEYSHYGDTEIPACRLKSSIDRLRNTPPGGASCLMETEFEKILNSPIPEPVKSCAAGAAEELRTKNRSQDILPYDRNRVILAPIPTRDYSTYINASFIEAYDNSEAFIITQDPLPSTIMDFWRMVAEHNVTTIVMLSELTEGKCPRYWDDGTAQYEHISVQYEESESCPYYTRRQFRVANNKVTGNWSEAVSVRQLQYHGWPTASGAVPEVTRGLAELADVACAAPAPAPTMLVHCQLGTERSALFVALCILISQLRTERRVDVCSVARKVRSQRANTIDTFLHYEFLHRAILNYAELHNLLEDS